MSNNWRNAAYWISRVLTVSVCFIATLQAGSPRQDRKLIHNVDPVYPELAQKNRIKGTVKLRLVVARNGKVKSAEPIGGHPVLVEAALNAVENWKYEPNGEETEVVVEFRFGVDEENKK